MNTKEAVEVIKKIKDNYVKDGGGICINEVILFEEIINLLKRGERKYEEMWRELENIVHSGEVYTLLPADLVNKGTSITAIVKAFESIKQKYFPKTFKESMGKNSLIDLAKQMNESYWNYIEAHLVRGLPIEPSHLRMFANGIIRDIERDMNND